MADWLFSFWGAVLPPAGLFIAYLAWGFPYFSGQLKTDPVYREKLAAALRGHAWLTGYRGWLSGALDGLDVWMGRPHSLRALRVCGTIAMVYASAFLLVSWALGGPGTIGTTPLLPVLPWWQQAAAGMAGLILFVGFAWIALRHQQVDAALRARAGALSAQACRR